MDRQEQLLARLRHLLAERPELVDLFVLVTDLVEEPAGDQTQALRALAAELTRRGGAAEGSAVQRAVGPVEDDLDELEVRRRTDEAALYVSDRTLDGVERMVRMQMRAERRDRDEPGEAQVRQASSGSAQRQNESGP